MGPQPLLSGLTSVCSDPAVMSILRSLVNPVARTWRGLPGRGNRLVRRLRARGSPRRGWVRIALRDELLEALQTLDEIVVAQWMRQPNVAGCSEALSVIDD